MSNAHAREPRQKPRSGSGPAANAARAVADETQRMIRQHRQALRNRAWQFARPLLVVNIRDGVQESRLDELRRVTG